MPIPHPAIAEQPVPEPDATDLLGGPRPYAHAWRTALLTLVVWLVITEGGGIISAGGHMTQLPTLISTRLAIGVAAAAAFIVLAISVLHWWRVVGFVRPSETGLLRLPSLVVLAFLAITIAERQLFQPGTGLVVLNTLLVGVSEELMFRGVLLFGARVRFGTNRAVFVTAAIFGAVHTLNALVTGNLPAAVIQALIASFFGVWAGALRVRTESLLPLIVIHWMWDGLLVLGGAGVAIVALVCAPALLFWGLRIMREYEEPPVAALVPPGPAAPGSA